MEQNSNAEKQARYRKKEKLRRQADNILRKWRGEPWKHHLKSVEELQHLIDAAIKLPYAWTEEDYLDAKNRLCHVYSEVVSPVNHITNDVNESRDAHNAFSSAADPSKFNSDLMKAVENTNALASHIISALKISGCSEADQASALMEAMRFVGRTLTNSHKVPCSQATAMCLATISPIYGRPDWFYEKISYTISQQHPEIAYKISNNLNKYTGKCHAKS